MARLDSRDFDAHSRLDRRQQVGIGDSHYVNAMRLRGWSLALSAALLGACASAPPGIDAEQRKVQVIAAERAFAKTMADRDLAAFASFVSNEAIFYSGPEPRRGKQAVVEWWKRFYEKPEAPFSWEPESVEVLESGTLALSSGPVRDGNGKQIATFNSIWRLEAPGTWRIIFDKGEAACNCR